MDHQPALRPMLGFEPPFEGFEPSPKRRGIREAFDLRIIIRPVYDQRELGLVMVVARF
jgi:hypothetical protein